MALRSGSDADPSVPARESTGDIGFPVITGVSIGTVDVSVTARDPDGVDIGSRAADAGAGDSEVGATLRSMGTAVTAGGVTRLWKRARIRSNPSNPATHTSAATIPAVTTAVVIRKGNGRRRTRRRGLPRAFTERGRDS